MTDIRKHGFESDTQWREYLEEIEEASTTLGRPGVQNTTVIQELRDLRQQLHALRERVDARIRHQRLGRYWRTIGAGTLLLLFMAASRRN